MNTYQIIKIALFGWIILTGISCAQMFDEQPKDYYTRNYGGFEQPPEDDLTLLSDEAEDDATSDKGQGQTARTDGSGKTLPPSDSDSEEEKQFLEGDTLEEKLFLLTASCHKIRDRYCFEERRTLFYASFPDSDYRDRIEEMQSTFYYYPDIDLSYLNNGILEIEMPFFSDKKEMKHYFQTIAEYGIKEVSWMPFQVEHENKILFAARKDDYGAYFQTDVIPVIEDVLGEMLEITKELGLKLHVKVPVRNHPWLQYYHSLLMSQSWEPIKKTEYYYPKLNLIHPYAEKYFLSLIDDLMAYPIDGIIFDDDFTFIFEEGFSTLNRILYEDETNVKIRPEQIFNEDLIKLRKEEFAPLYKPRNKDFREYTQWRMEKTQKFMTNIMDYIRFTNDSLTIGLEVTPAMILLPRVSFYLYTITGNAISGLPVDLYILDWKKNTDVASAAESQYLKALDFIQRNKDEDQKIIVKALLVNKADGVEKINDSIRYTLNIADKFKADKYVISSVNRLNNTDIVLDYFN